MSSISQKVASLALGDLVARGLGFVSSMVLARALGPESYGFGQRFSGFLLFNMVF